MKLKVLVCAVSAALSAFPAMAADKALDELTVTGTREGVLLSETPASVGVVKGATVQMDKPTHPAQIMNQIPGAAVTVTNGEGHTTAIRQPFTTNPLYQFLEDGVPIQSTGFFNHNALYMINIPQSGGLEVVRGPGTALYGSDAIGGVVNVLSKTPPAKGEAGFSAEVGEHGWWRLLVDGGNRSEDDGWRASVNLTHTDGWRDQTAYDRQSGTFRWDHSISGQAALKTVAAFSTIDQETGAGSSLIRADYENNPTKNYFPIAYRKVSAFRVSSAYEREDADSQLSIIPYYRNNSMELLASFSLNSDPNVYTTGHQSFGVLTKWRQDFVPMRARLIAGVDLDISPGEREEDRVFAIPDAGTAGASRVYRSYTLGARIYDYEVTYQGVSPYVHGEFSPTDRLRVTAGLRYDYMRYVYDNNLNGPVSSTAPGGATGGNRTYGQASDTTLSYDHLSPKLGATFALSPSTSVFAAYNHSFRAPSESQLFRPSSVSGTNAAAQTAAQQSAQAALALEPIKADQFEVGVRGKASGIKYEVSVYQLEKRDDIISYTEPVTNIRRSTNAGETRHRGVEVGLGVPLGANFSLDTALSYAKHTYEEWVVPGTPTVVLSGKEMESAPRVIANTRLTWSPAKGQRVQLEWVRLGEYWMDNANTTKYEGHDLLNVRGNWGLNKHWGVFGSLSNVLDERYADSASVSSSTPVLSPGLPRTVYLGVEGKW